MKRTLSTFVNATKTLTTAVVIAAVALASGLLVKADVPQVASGRWVAAGDLGALPADTAAVALADGRLVVAGGRGADGAVTAQVGIYDPATSAWADGGQLLQARAGHAAAALADGRVLIAGGVTDAGVTADVEIYDPASQTSAQSGAMWVPRVNHAAAALKDGGVLIVGGSDGSLALDFAEVFDAKTGQSRSLAATLSSKRAKATATTLLDGHVLVAGGNDGARDLASAEIFDPETETFFATGTLSAARSGHVAVLLPNNNQVLIAGGTVAGAAAASAELYADWRDGFSAAPNAMSVARAGAVGGGLAPYDLAIIAGGGSSTAEYLGYATVKTDKEDYKPGEIVTVTGSGWQPGETVSIKISEDADTHNDFVFQAVADANGRIVNSEFAPIEDEVFHHFGMRFYITAAGAASQALNTFTDGGILIQSPTTASPAMVQAGETFNVTINTTGQSGTRQVAVYVFASGSPNACSNLGTNASNVSGCGTNDVVAVFPAYALGGVITTTVTIMPGTAAGTYHLRANVPSLNGVNDTMSNSVTVTAQTTTVTASSASGPYGGTTVLSATLKSAANTPISGKTIAFTLNGAGAGSATTDASGVATANASLGTIAVGSYPTGVGASFAGDTSYAASSGSNALNVSKADQTISVVAPATLAYNQTAALSTTGSSGTGAISYTVTSGSCSLVNGNELKADSGTGSCTVTATIAEDANYSAATSAPATVALAKATQTITLNAPATLTYNEQATLSTTGNGGTGAISYTVTSGSCSLANGNELKADSGTGACTVTASIAGDNNYEPATSAPVTVTLAKANASVSLSDLTKTYDGSPQSPTATTTPTGLTVSWTGAPETNAGSYPVTATIDSDNYQGSATGTFAISKAASSTTVTCGAGPFTYTGGAHTPCSASVSGPGGLSIASHPVTYENNTNAGTATGSASYEESANHLASSDSKTFEIAKADAACSVTGYTGTYDGAAHGASGSCVDVNNQPLSGLDLGASFTNAPGGTADWSFAGNGNYNAKSGTAAIVINKADATCTINGYAGTYDGSAHGASGSCVGVDNQPLSGLDLGASFTNAPGGTANWSFAGNDNYKPASGTATIQINKAVASVTVAPVTATFDGQAHGTTGSVTGVGGADLGAATMTYEGGSAPVNAGSYTATGSFAGDGNYEPASGTATIKINKATATINVSGFSGTYNGQAHGATGTATGIGDADLSSLLTLGDKFTNVPGGTANWSFAGNENYEPASGSVAIAIGKATLTTTLTAENKTYDGSAAATVSCVVDGIGEDDVACVAANGAFDTRNAGTGKTVTADVTISGADAGNYTVAATATTTASISKLDITVTAATDTKVYNGNTSSAATPTASAAPVGGDTVAWTQVFDAKDAGSRQLKASGTVSDGNGGNNYNVTFVPSSGSITARALVGSMTAGNKPYDATTAATITGRSLSGVVAGDDVAYVNGTATFADASAGTGKTVTAVNLELSGGDAANYTVNSTATATAAITPLATTTTVSGPGTSQYSDLVTLTATVSATAGAYPGGLQGSVQFFIGSTPFGAPVAVSGSGAATVSRSALVENNVGIHGKSATFTPATGNYVGSSASGAFEVKPENANPSSDSGAYTGQLSAWTPTATSNTATLTLAATIKDDSVDPNTNDLWPGNIATAKVSFAMRTSAGALTPINGGTNLPVGLVNAGDKTVGTAAATLQFSLNSNEICGVYTIAIMVSGNYNMPTPTYQDTTISVCRATPGSIVSNPAAGLDAVGSAGFIAGSSKTTFDVKYNKSLTNPQGKVQVIIRSDRNALTGLPDDRIHTYVITSNAISTLSVKSPAATFSAKANVIELVDNVDGSVTAVSIDGGAIIQLALTDGATDTLAVTVNKSRGGLWFSSGWNGTKTVEKALVTGALRIMN